MPLTLKQWSMVTIMGIKGDGKSWLSRALMKDWQYDYCFVHDPMNCYPLTDFLTCSDIEEVIDAMMQGQKKVRLSMGVPSDMVLLIDFLKEFDNILIVIDEADQLFSRSNNPEALIAAAEASFGAFD